MSFPINLNGKRINTVQALWLRGKNEIKEDEYDEFYKFQAHDSEKPRLRLLHTISQRRCPHLQSTPTPYSSSLPHSNTEKMGLSRLEPAVALYCRRY